MKNKVFDFGDFEITTREILASITIIAVMLMIGIVISGKIQEKQIDTNEVYNKAVRIDSADLFQYGMETNVGNAFVYGDLEAVDTVSYPEIDGQYMYVEKVKEQYEKHERTVTKKDKDGKEYEEKEEYYQWDVDDRESIHCDEISFLGIVFLYGKIQIPSGKHIDTIKGDREWSYKSGEMVKVRYVYYGVGMKYTGTIFTDLRNNTISEKTQFYANKTIGETVEHLKHKGGVVIFWIFWIILICACVFGFCYWDNRWLE